MALFKNACITLSCCIDHHNSPKEGRSAAAVGWPVGSERCGGAVARQPGGMQ